MSSKVPQPFRVVKAKRSNVFTDAPGRGDGMVRGRMSSDDVPFGKPFKYTDAYELTGNFRKPGATRTLLKGHAVGLRWWERLKNRFTRWPLGYVVVEPEHGKAYVMHGGNEVKVTPFECGVIVPVYDDRIILAMDAYEEAVQE